MAAPAHDRRAVPPLVGALLGVAVGVVLGGAVGVCGLAVHRGEWSVAGVDVPWGGVLAVAAAVLTPLGLAATRVHRAAVVAYAVAWIGVLLIVLGGRPEGDYLVAGDARGYGFLVLGSLGVVAAALGALVAAPVAPGRAAADDLGRSRRRPP